MKVGNFVSERFLSTKDVCARLGVHRNTVLRYVKAGKFGKVLRLEQDIRFPESSLQKFIEERMA
jgi:excisionase family DNA binding protein